VKETHFINHHLDAQLPGEERVDCKVIYRADPMPCQETQEQEIRWRSSIFMPRWASRILLEITDVRIERLQGISEVQAISEGVLPQGKLWRGTADLPGFANPISAYATLWDSINGVESWEANPWVWVVEFKRIG
jgi:hypothetical protein